MPLKIGMEHCTLVRDPRESRRPVVARDAVPN